MEDEETFIQSMGYPIFSGGLSNISVNKKITINTLNQYSFCIAEKDLEFKEALQKSDILLPDGISIVMAVRILNQQRIRKIAGADIHKYLLQELNILGGTCFYLGASEYTLTKIKQKIIGEFPYIKVETYSPPYKVEFSDTESIQMIEAINSCKPDVLFIGMTAPKQEKWAYKFRKQLDANVVCSIGAVFDFYAGVITRPHSFWVKLGLEWFIRLVKEPKRMWKRYLYYGPFFIKWVFVKRFKGAIE